MIKALDEEKLKTLLPEMRILLFDEIDSTNTEARRRAENGELKLTLILSRFQSAGRGRQGKSFYSPKNTGLYMSLLYPVTGKLFDVVRVTAKTSAAVYRGLKPYTEKDLFIKWVNDIYLEDRKISGNLVESVTEGDNISLKALIIGIGVNLSTEDFPEDIKDKAGSLKLQGGDMSKIAASIIRELLKELQDLSGKDYLELYRSASNVLGKEISYTENGQERTGFAEAIDDDGALLVRTGEGSIVALSSGEISVRVR